MAGKRRLQEVFAHMAGSGDLLCHSDGTHIYTAGADATIRVFAHSASFTLLSSLSNHHSLPIRSLALSPSGDSLASSADDHLIQLFTLPPPTSSASAQPKFESTLYRSAGPTHSLSYHPSSLYLALGCADGVIRVISTLDPTNIRELKGHQSTVRFLAYDPTGDLLASIDHLGCLCVSQPNTRSTLILEPNITQRFDLASHMQMAKLAWSPDSEYLALPGKRDISIRAKANGWKRGGAERTLKGGHSDDVSVLEWSASGRYLLSTSATRVVVWEVDSGEVVSQVDIDVPCLAVHWAVQLNAILMLDENGYIKKWDSPIPSHMPPPHVKPDAVDEVDRAIDTDTLDPFTTTNEDEDDDAPPAPSAQGGEEVGQRRKRLRKAGEVVERGGEGGGGGGGGGDEDFDDDDMDDFIVDDTGGQYKDTEDDYLSRKARQALTQSAHCQPPFQPASTPVDPVTDRRYLSFNLIGSIISRREPAFSSLEITFADSAQHKPVRLRDHYGFSMAALGEHGCVMASKWESSARGSVVFYRAFDSWAANSDWTLHLPSPETAVTVAVGAKFVAVGTDRQYIRLMSYSGVQLAVWSVRGPVVTMVGQGNLLITAYHTAMPLPSHQALHALVMDVQRKTVLADCPLPLSPGATLTWLGCSDRGLVLSMDSAGVLRGLSHEWGGQWVPVLDVAAKGGKDVYWPVGLIEDKLMCALCKGGQKVPNTLNRPVLMAVELHLPFVITDSHTQEEQHARTHLLHYQSHLHTYLTSSTPSSSSSTPTPSTFHYNPSPREQAALDKVLIPLFHLAVSADQGHRAVDLASRLSLLKSMEICYTLANQGRRVALAGRVGLLMGARRKEKEEEKERERGGGGGSISIASLIDRGERRAEEEKKARMERLRLEEEGVGKRKVVVVDDGEEGDDGGDEGETELTYTKAGKKRVKVIERSEVLQEREERAMEAAKDREEADKRKAEREKERRLVEAEDDVVVEDPQAAKDFLNAFRRPKEPEKSKKRRKEEEGEEEEHNGDKHEEGGEEAENGAKQKKGKEEEKEKVTGGKGKGEAKAVGKGKEKGKRKEEGRAETEEKEKPKVGSKAKRDSDKGSRKGRTAVEEKVREKEGEKEADADTERDATTAKALTKPVNPFAKRTFA